MDNKFNIISAGQPLDELTNVKSLLKSRIQGRGVTVDVGLVDYGDKIREIADKLYIWIWDGTTTFAQSTYVPAISFVNVNGTYNDSPFWSCKAEDLHIYDTSHLLDMSGMFTFCDNLATAPHLDTSNVTNMRYMFKGCTSLTTIPRLGTSNVELMDYMFAGCTSLTTIPRLSTSNVRSMGYMFYECSSLIAIPLLDTSNVTDSGGTYRMFSGCRSLTNLGGFKNLQKSLDLTSCTNLTHESLMNVINNLARVNTSPVLTLGGINLAKLTDDEIAIATDKGWVVN